MTYNKKNMKFEFAKYHDITTIAHKHSEEYKGYKKIFLCVDVNDFWIARIQEGYNEDYEREEGKWMVERNKIGKDSKKQTIEGLHQIKKVLDLDLEDGLSNWDYEVRDSEEEVVDLLDDGFGFGETFSSK